MVILFVKKAIRPPTFMSNKNITNHGLANDNLTESQNFTGSIQMRGLALYAEGLKSYGQR